MLLCLWSVSSHLLSQCSSLNGWQKNPLFNQQWRCLTQIASRRLPGSRVGRDSWWRGKGVTSMFRPKQWLWIQQGAKNTIEIIMKKWIIRSDGLQPGVSVYDCRFQWQRIRLSYHAILWWSISSDLFFKGQMYTFFHSLMVQLQTVKGLSPSAELLKKTVTDWSNSADVCCITDSVGNKQLEGWTYCLAHLFSFVWQSLLKP